MKVKSLKFHSLSTTAELIGQNCNSAAFIYGVISLADKFASGLAVMAVQSLEPNFEEECTNCASCHTFFSQVIFYVLGGAALTGGLSMLSLVPFNIGHGLRKESSAIGKRHQTTRNSIVLTKFNSTASYPATAMTNDLDENETGENPLQLSVIDLDLDKDLDHGKSLRSLKLKPPHHPHFLWRARTQDMHPETGACFKKKSV